MKMLFNRSSSAWWLSHGTAVFLESVGKTRARQPPFSMGLRTGFSVVLYSLFAQEGSREAEKAQRSSSEAPKALILGVVFSKTSFKNQITSYPFKITPVSPFAYSISKENPDLHLRIGKSVSVRSLPGLSALARSCFLIFLGRSQFDK